MMSRTQELCRKLKPILGRRIDGLWAAYVATADADGKADIEQTLELLAIKHLKQDYQPDRAPFPPPSRQFAAGGDVALGEVVYAGDPLYPFALRSVRLKEHVIVAGRSGSGKTNLTFVLMRGLMARGIKVLALDWKRGYRDLLALHPEIRVYTVGREVAPFRFNPLIPPPGCEPNVWIKLIVDVIASAYYGGEGVISLLVAGLTKLFNDAGVYDGTLTRWPTVPDLLQWLQAAKLRGRAAMWQASAERILLAMTYGEFGAVVDAQDNGMVSALLQRNVVLEMDGLSSNSDRTMFSEALVLYLYRTRLAQGPQPQLTNVVVLEEAHNLLLQRAAETRESVLENSIRMIRQYGLGYVFVDQSASLLSKVAFANSYATLALSQKLKADVQAIAGACNLTDEQKEALNTLPIGTAVVRLADEHPEPFLIQVPRCPIREGAVRDVDVRRAMEGDFGGSSPDPPPQTRAPAIPAVPARDEHRADVPHPPTPEASGISETDTTSPGIPEQEPPPSVELSREAMRFLADVAAHPLSTTVARYHRLHLSRRRGDAVRRDLLAAGIVQAVVIATRSGQVVLHQLTDVGRSVAAGAGLDPGPVLRTSLEHAYWAARVAAKFVDDGYDVDGEYAIPGDGVVDLVAERCGQRVAIEVETGKSDIAENVRKALAAGFDRVVLLATSPGAVSACQRVLQQPANPRIQVWSWLDLP